MMTSLIRAKYGTVKRYHALKSGSVPEWREKVTLSYLRSILAPNSGRSGRYGKIGQIILAQLRKDGFHD